MEFILCRLVKQPFFTIRSIKFWVFQYQLVVAKGIDIIDDIFFAKYRRWLDISHLCKVTCFRMRIIYLFWKLLPFIIRIWYIQIVFVHLIWALIFRNNRESSMIAFLNSSFVELNANSKTLLTGSHSSSMGFSEIYRSENGVLHIPRFKVPTFLTYLSMLL